MVPRFTPPALSCLSNLKINLSKMELIDVSPQTHLPKSFGSIFKTDLKFFHFSPTPLLLPGPINAVPPSEIRISTLTSLLLCLGPPIHFPHRGQSYLLNINLILALPCLKPINGSICTQNKLQPPSPCPPPAGPGPWVPLQHQLTAPTLHHAQACYPSVSSYNMPISFYPQVLCLQSIKLWGLGWAEAIGCISKQIYAKKCLKFTCSSVTTQEKNTNIYK